MASAHTIASQVRDTIDVLTAVTERAARADTQARPPSRRPDHQPTAKGHTDPTGHTATEVFATLERVQSSMQEIKAQAYRVAAELQDWAPARHWDNGVRRCGIDGCANKHHARGLCEKHYRYELRAEGTAPT